MGKESVEKFLLMGGQADATAKAHTVSAIMTQERRIDEVERQNAALQQSVDAGHVQTAKALTLINELRNLVDLTKKPRKKRANQPQNRDNGPLSRIGK